jgi:hypothetical protein
LKVFGIGLNKTGTSTLGAAGELLGLRDKSWDAGLFHDTMIEGRRDRLWRAIDEFDLFNDFPYPLLYPEIDARYPNAKFVLTRRSSPEVWLSSIKSHSMRASPSSRTHRVVYGLRYPHGCEDLYLEYYKRHFETAREYFANRPDDFLEICWEEEGELSRLHCVILGIAADYCCRRCAGNKLQPRTFSHGPSSAKVNPGSWMLTNNTDPSGEKHAPQNSP